MTYYVVRIVPNFRGVFRDKQLGGLPGKGFQNSRGEVGKGGGVVVQKAGPHTYRAHFTGFCSASCSSCWCGCSCDFAHRLQSFAPDRHLLLVVVVVALLLAHEQLVTVAGKVRRALGDLRVGCGRRRRCVGLEFGLFRCGRFFRFLRGATSGG